MFKQLTIFAAIWALELNAAEIIHFDNLEQIKADFVERSVKMVPSRESNIRDIKYRINLKETDINGDNKNDYKVWGIWDLGRPSQSRVYLCASSEKDCSKGGYCYAGYFPGPEIDKGIPDLKCKE